MKLHIFFKIINVNKFDENRKVYISWVKNDKKFKYSLFKCGYPVFHQNPAGSGSGTALTTIWQINRK